MLNSEAVNKASGSSRSLVSAASLSSEHRPNLPLKTGEFSSLKNKGESIELISFDQMAPPGGQEKN